MTFAIVIGMLLCTTFGIFLGAGGVFMWLLHRWNGQ